VYHPFPAGNDSALWVQEDFDSQGSTHFLRTYLYGDTVLGSYPYKKLYRTSVNAMVYPPPTPPSFKNDNSFIGALREDIAVKRVYYYDAFFGVERLMYDFSLMIGDTAFVDYPWGDTVIYTVAGIDSILVNTVYHKRLIIEPLTGGFDSAPWIEGIGSEAGPLNYFFSEGAASNTLACFGVNEINMYSYFVWPPAPECRISVGIGELENNSISFGVLPNPTSGTVTLSLSCTGSYFIEVLNSNGEIILKETKPASIDLNEFSNGNYLIRLSDEKGNSVTKKIVKQ
jgi:hypothetical protein